MQQALERKRSEMKVLMKENSQLKKELSEWKNRPEQRIHEDVSSERSRIMRRWERRGSVTE